LQAEPDFSVSDSIQRPARLAALSARRILQAWLVIVVIATAVHLGSVPLLDADEGRNAEVGREMAATNDYVMPRLDGLPYLDKPVVYFAAEAAAMEVLGPTEVAARLPAYLFTLATAGLLFWFARKVWGGDAPWVAAIVFLSMPLVIAFARTVIFDSALTFFAIAALAAFYFAVEERAARWSIPAWAAMGLAMITKGPVTFVLVLFVAIPFAWRRKALRKLFHPAGLLLFAAVIAPWVWGVSQVVPEFLRYVLVTETAQRMATGALKRTGPPWYFIPYLVGGGLPWSFVALFNWKRFNWRRPERPDPALLYWILAIAIPFLFFSMSQSKRPQYILPLMPALALLIARIWEEARTRASAVVLATLGGLLLVATPFLHHARMKPELMAVADFTAIAFGIVFALGGLAAMLSRRREIVLVALTLPVVAIPLLADPMLRAIALRRSAKAFAEQLAPTLTPSTRLIGVEAVTGSMAFYLQRPVLVVTRDASELTSNYLMRRYDRFVTDPTSPLRPLAYFEQSLAATDPRVYIVRQQDTKWRSALEARGWRVIADSTRHVAYGR
jgi:4-amino-4-deoxy-L-arabinose transferase-like glycosyltransferase